MTDDKTSLNIYQRINNIMEEVKTIGKEDKKVNGQYTFVSHDEVARVMHQALTKHRIVMAPSVVNLSQDTNRTCVMMEIEFINIDKPDERFMVRYPGYGIDAQDKGIGKAISYAVKYALLKTFCLETSDDVEKDNIDHKPSQQNQTTRPAYLIGEKQAANLANVLDAKPDSIKDRLKQKFHEMGVNSTYELSGSQYNQIIENLREIELSIEKTA